MLSGIIRFDTVGGVSGMNRVVVISQLVRNNNLVGNIEADTTIQAIGTGRVIRSIDSICVRVRVRIRVTWQRHRVGTSYVHCEICLLGFA
jgi:hypothetical protein